MIETVGGFDPDQAWDGRSKELFHDYGPGSIIPETLRGAYGGAYESTDGRWRFARDPLGINSVFWAEHDDRLLVAARAQRLVAAGASFGDIRSLPRGVVVDMGEERHADQKPRNVEQPLASPKALSDVHQIAASIRDRLDHYLDALRADHAAHVVYVCLSGGIDSTAIAMLALDHFPDLTFVSFDLSGADGTPSEDRMVARRVADDHGSPLLEVDLSIDELLEQLDVVLIEGVDWRDFNVHAALVNSALAQGIRESAGDGPAPLVLTGDLANEFMADYQQENVRGAASYRLPSVPIGSLRRLLIKGLDTSHREVGIFTSQGQRLAQPYAVAVDDYLAIPDAFLEKPDCKQRLAVDITSDRMPRYVLQRTKVRAQVGGSDGGVLGAFLDRGIDQAALKARFASLHDTEPSMLDRFIRGGLYRSAIPPIGETASKPRKGSHDTA